MLGSFLICVHLMVPVVCARVSSLIVGSVVYPKSFRDVSAVRSTGTRTVYGAKSIMASILIRRFRYYVLEFRDTTFKSSPAFIPLKSETASLDTGVPRPGEKVLNSCFTAATLNGFSFSNFFLIFSIEA